MYMSCSSYNTVSIRVSLQHFGRNSSRTNDDDAAVPKSVLSRIGLIFMTVLYRQ
jgi:hypothetical protein